MLGSGGEGCSDDAAAERAAAMMIAEEAAEKRSEEAKAARAAKATRTLKAARAARTTLHDEACVKAAEGADSRSDLTTSKIGLANHNAGPQPAPSAVHTVPTGPGVAMRVQAAYGWRCELIGSSHFFDGQDVDLVVEVPHCSSLEEAYYLLLATCYLLLTTLLTTYY